MNSDDANKRKGKFDPNTGERIIDDSGAAEAPTTAGHSAPTTGPLGDAPSTATSANVDAFRAPYQEPDSMTPAQAPQSEQAAYQQPSYSSSQAPTQPYSYEATPQPPTQPAPQYPSPYTYQQQPTATQTPPVAPAAPPKTRSRAPLIAGIIAVVLVIGLAVGGYAIYQNVINKPAVSVERLLPTNTLGYFSFDPVLEGNQKAAMDKIGEAFQSQPGFKAAWDKITSNSASTLSEMGSGCGGDTSTPTSGDLDAISSYLGNSITVAVLAPSSDDLQKLQDAQNNGDPGSAAGDIAGKNIVGVVDLDFNPLNKKGPISDLKQQTQNLTNAETVEKYRDIDIHKFTPKDCGSTGQSTAPTSLFFALLDNSSTALVAVNAAPLHALIDSYRDNKALKDDETFKALSGQVPQDRIAALYLNLTQIYKEVGLVAPELTQSQSVQNINGSMLLTLSAANDGLQIDSASETDLSLMGQQVQVNPNAKPDEATLSDIPSDSLAFLAGTDLQSVLQSALDAARKSTTQQGSGSIDQQIKDFEQQYGVSVENDILPLLSGDYALSVSADSLGDTLRPSVFFEIKVKDSQKASDVIGKLAAALGGTDLQPVTISGGQFYSPSNSGLILGVANDRILAMYDTDSQNVQTHITTAIGNLGKGFGTGTAWAGVKTHLTRDSNVIGYVDISSTRTLLEKEFLQDPQAKSDYDQNTAPLVVPLKYFLFGSATQAAKNGTLSRNHTVMFIGISK